jgi:DNA-binding protein HU-beta
MTKADIVSEIAIETGIDKVSVVASVDAFMEVVKSHMLAGENVYLRGFGTFLIKKRRRKTARNISRNTTIIIPEHNVPAFKPSKLFLHQVSDSVKVSSDDNSVD